MANKRLKIEADDLEALDIAANDLTFLYYRLNEELGKRPTSIKAVIKILDHVHIINFDLKALAKKIAGYNDLL